MANRFNTPQFRAAFISVFKARAQKQQDGSMGEAKYTVRAAFPPTTDLSQMKSEAALAAKEKWGDKVPKNIRSPFRLNEELDNPVAGLGDDWTIVTFSAKADNKPGVVDAQVNEIMDESEVYSGAWFRVQTRAYAYDQAGNKGVSFALDNIQKMKDDEAIGNSKPKATAAFEAVGTTSGKTADDIFG